MPIPPRAWFRMQPPSDLYGPGHTARVMAWASVLTRGTGWFEPVVWAAACHDLRRRDDGADPRHGFRAGTWVRTKLPDLLRQPPQDLELIASACDWHVCADRESRWTHPVLWLLKDADGLDRVRLYDLDASFFRHRQTRRFVAPAQALYAATAGSDDPSEVWQAAAKLELPVDELLEWAARQAANLRNEPMA